MSEARQSGCESESLDLARAALQLREGVERSAQRILGCADAAHDAVQESLITLWLHPPTHAHGRRWLARTIVHRSLHERRTRQRRRHWEEAAGSAFDSEPSPFDPERNLERRELATILERALRALPEPHRACFELREIEGWDYQQIALELDVPVGTVRSRLSRARAALREQLAGVLGRPSERDDARRDGREPYSL